VALLDPAFTSTIFSRDTIADVVQMLTRMRDERGDAKDISVLISAGRHVVVVLQFPEGAKEMPHG
jgi:hypothetical protein